LQMPKYGHTFSQIQPPVNQRLEGTSSWVNMLAEIDTITPKGWRTLDETLETAVSPTKQQS
jgi:hypothetical protein